MFECSSKAPIALAALTWLCGTSGIGRAADADPPTAAEATAAEATAAAPKAGVARARRIIEPRSGIEFRMEPSWQAEAGSGTRYRLNGKNDEGELELRYPLNYPDPPANAQAARQLDLDESAANPSKLPRNYKEIDNPVPDPAVGPGLGLDLYSSRHSRLRDRHIERKYYLTTPASAVITVSCVLPEESVADGDACQRFVASAAMMPERERSDRLSLVQTQEQRSSAGDNYRISCATVNAELAAWRTANTGARLEQMPRFATQYSQLMVKAYVGGNTREITAATQSASAYLERVAAACAARPESTYGDALDAAR